MLIKKRKIAFLFMISIFIALSACGGNSSNAKPTAEAVSTNNQAETETPAQNSTNAEADGQANTADPNLKITAADGTGKGESLPDTYPTEIFPLYKDSYILSVVELSGGFTITAFSKDDFNNIADFYKELLKSATVTFETDSDTGFTSMGKIGAYTYNFDTGASSELDGYVSSIVIILTPAQ